MNELKDWFSLCEHLGLGATFVLGIVCVLLWRDRVDDKKYIRDSERRTLEILNKVTGLLDASNIQNSTAKGEIIGAVNNARDLILSRVEQAKH